MRKFLSILVMLVMVVVSMAVSKSAYAATTDTFTITVTVNYIEMQIVLYDQVWGGTEYTTWPIGSLATDSTDTMIEAEGVKVVLGTTSQTVDIQSHVSNQGVAWTVAAAHNANVYAILAKGYSTTQATPVTTGGTQLTTGALDVTGATAVASGAARWLYYSFDSPTSTITGAEQTITITVAIVVS